LGDVNFLYASVFTSINLFNYFLRHSVGLSDRLRIHA